MAAAAAVPARDSSSDTTSVKRIPDRAPDERPKKARQLFSGGAYRKTLKKREEEAKGDDQTEDAAVEKKDGEWWTLPEAGSALACEGH